MYGSHCYLGFNLEDEIIYRPIYKEEPGTYESNFLCGFQEKIILTLKYFFCCMVELKKTENTALKKPKKAIFNRCGRVMADNIAYAKFRKSLLI